MRKRKNKNKKKGKIRVKERMITYNMIFSMYLSADD